MTEEIIEIIKGYNTEKTKLSEYPLVLLNYTADGTEERRKEAQERINTIDKILLDILDRIAKKKKE